MKLMACMVVLGHRRDGTYLQRLCSTVRFVTKALIAWVAMSKSSNAKIHTDYVKTEIQ